MEITRDSLRKVFGPGAEECAGSFLLEVDGVKQEVATLNLHTGAYALSVAGAALVEGAGTPKAPTKPAAKSAGKGLKDTPPVVTPEPAVGLETGDVTVELTGQAAVDAALASLDLDDEIE